jgi:Glutathione S-transferase, C-terminal domain
VAVIFSAMGDNVPKDFIADREKLSGRPFDVAGMKAVAPLMIDQWRAYAAWLEAGLAGQNFLGGAAPSMADVACWMNIWWTGGAVPPDLRDRLFAGLSNIQAWRERLKAIGHGRRSEMAPAEALKIATASQPAAVSVAADHSGLKSGDAVTVQADDYGRDAIEGTLVGLAPDRITVARSDKDLGDIHVHFPRAGYVLARR